MIINQQLIASILAKTFPEDSMIQQEDGRHIEFGILAARITHDLNKAISLHDKICQINTDIAALYLKKDELISSCEHFAEKLDRDYEEGTVTISCQVCGEVSYEGEANDS